MISRTSRLLHAALGVVCGAGIVYAPVQAQTALTLQWGQPGYFGPINLGNQPLYLRVPMNQARDWGRYCSLYQACNVPVQFVRDDWYRNVYAPRVQAAQAKQARDHWRAYGPQKRRGWDNDD
jgi:hypothetical protein